MDKKWTIKKIDKAKAENISAELNIDTILGVLLSQRGIESFDKAKHFFRPQLSDLHDPYLMKGMKEAVSRISTIINKKEKILIYGDYDVDGTCSVAMVYHFLSQLSDQIEYYIPDRYKEGYGLSDLGVDYAIENNFSLVITLDCGIKSVDKVERGSKAGLDFIICDHHMPGPIIPSAIAVLDPKQEDCSYPFSELCGCGVGFKLIQALCDFLLLDPEIAKAYLDLVSLAIAADIVPVTGENRILCFYGLKQFNQGARTGLKALLPITEGPKTYRVSDLVFTLAPRINAAGRIRSGREAVKLMIEDSPEEALHISKQIEEDNTNRRALDQEITLQALDQVENDPKHTNKKSNVVYQEDWHKGVVGIVASRLIEKHFKPTIVLTRSGEVAAGSARSVPGFDLYQALENCSEHLIQFGGHKYAAGMTLEIDQITTFKKAFEEEVAQSITAEQLLPELIIDAELNFNEINHKLFRIIQQMAPFGPGNLEPIFISRTIENNQWSKKVGSDGQHLKLHMRQGNSQSLDGIAFNFGHLADEIINGTPFDIVYSLQENTWNGKTTLQLMVKDIKLKPHSSLN